MYIPFNKKYTFDEAKDFAEILAHLVVERLPKLTTLESHSPSEKQPYLC